MTFHHPQDRFACVSDIVEAGHRGDVDLPIAALEADDPTLRAAAAGALLRLGELDRTRWQQLAEDPDPAVRRRAAELAPRLESPMETETALIALLDDTDEIVEVAAFALGEVGSAERASLTPTAIERLEQIVRGHDDALCREAAVAALGALHTGLDTILHACTDKATVRRRAVIALAPFDGPEVDAALKTALEDRDWQVRQAAEDLLGPEADPADS